jgi:hypothetical protein
MVYLEYQQEDNEEDPFAGVEEKNIPTGEETRRIAIQSLDWEHIRAVDLFVLLSSFCKGKQKIVKVEIYPSEFGIKEMEREKVNGPDAEIFDKDKKHRDIDAQVIHDIEDIIEDDEKDDYRGYDQIKLRTYELKKLKYYYAVVHCDSKETSLDVYTQCDGMEIERTQCMMDMRFIPDSLTSFPYPPKDVCKTLPNDYEPNFGFNRALQHSKVKLTWDSNDHKRNELISKAFKKEQFNQEEIQQLLVSSDSEDDDGMNEFNDLLNTVDESKELNLLKRKKNKELNIREGETIHITFNKGFEGINTSDHNKTTQKDKSLWDQYKEKKKNKRREKKMEEKEKRDVIKDNRKGQQGGNAPSNKKTLGLLVDESLKDKAFRYNAEDDRFKAVKMDSKYAVDPTNKDYKRAKK